MLRAPFFRFVPLALVSLLVSASVRAQNPAASPPAQASLDLTINEFKPVMGQPNTFAGTWTAKGDFTLASQTVVLIFPNDEAMGPKTISIMLPRKAFIGLPMQKPAALPAHFELVRATGPLVFNLMAPDGSLGRVSMVLDRSFHGFHTAQIGSEPSPAGWLRMAALDIDGPFIEVMNRCSVGHVDDLDLYAVKTVGVPPSYAAALHEAGGRFRVSEICHLFQNGVTPQSFKRLQDRSSKPLSVETIIELDKHGVSDEALQKQGGQ